MMLKGEKKMSKVFKILTINPGSTSTKIAIFVNDNLILEKTLRHSITFLWQNMQNDTVTNRDIR